MDHSAWRKEGGQQIAQDPVGIFRFLELSITDRHSEFGFVGEGTLRKIGGQLFESPKSFFCLPLGEENLPLSEEKRIIYRADRFGL
jgi:hypothetical protein